MTEIRFHGRFGQPVGKLVRTLGQHMLQKGKHVQIFDSFAAFRPGAPMYSVFRVADDFIRERSANNTKPDMVVVLDNSLFAVVDLTQGLKPGGLIMALRPDQNSLKELGGSYRFVNLEPYFSEGSNVEANLLNVLESQIIK